MTANNVAFAIGALIGATVRGIWLVVLPAFGVAHLAGWI